MWYLLLGFWFLIPGLWCVICGAWNLRSHVWYLVCGVSYLTFDLWDVMSDVCYVILNLWLSVSGIWHVASDVWYLTFDTSAPDIWHVKCNIWYLTCHPWRMVWVSGSKRLNNIAISINNLILLALCLNLPFPRPSPQRAQGKMTARGLYQKPSGFHPFHFHVSWPNVQQRSIQTLGQEKMEEWNDLIHKNCCMPNFNYSTISHILANQERCSMSRVTNWIRKPDNTLW